MPEIVNTEKGWREIWVSSGKPDRKNTMIVFKDSNGKVVQTVRHIGDVEVLTCVPDAANVLVTIV